MNEILLMGAGILVGVLIATRISWCG